MTREQKLAAIREACVKVNPSINATEFGSYVSGRGLHNAKVVLIYDISAFVIRSGGKQLEQIDLTDNNYKFTGREIGLADVMMAICEKARLPGNYLLGMNGVFFEWTNMDNPPKILDESWNPRLSLDEQDDPTVDFIYELTNMSN